MGYSPHSPSAGFDHLFIPLSSDTGCEGCAVAHSCGSNVGDAPYI